MTAMTQQFDGVRELSMDEVDAVAGGPFWVPILVGVGITIVGDAALNVIDGASDAIAGRENATQSEAEG
ncbi:MAG: hypothetical protein RKE49_01825 [Oceanicaulis sp.]